MHGYACTHPHSLPAPRPLLLLPHSLHFFSNQEEHKSEQHPGSTRASLVCCDGEQLHKSEPALEEEATQTWSPRKQARGHRALADVWGQLF